jgi:small subunit ribosomal protein S8e
MVVIQKRSNKKPSGGRYTFKVNKRLSQKGRKPSNTRVGKVDARTTRTKGGNSKTHLLNVDKVNVIDPKTKKHVVADVKSVVENNANRHFIRRNILTKGAVVDTNKGKVKITSRPGQEGMVNGILLE